MEIKPDRRPVAGLCPLHESIMPRMEKDYAQAVPYHIGAVLPLERIVL